jgi:hypothetical protein
MHGAKNRLVFATTKLGTLLLLAALTASLLAPQASANLTGTVLTPPSATVFPGLVPPGTNPGTLLASLKDPFVSTLGLESGTLVSAVYRETGGTLDFYYQISESLTAPNCGGPGQQPCDPLARMTATNFFGFATSTGFRTDGSTLPFGVFVNGTVVPVTADRNSVGDVVGFSFNPPDAAKIQPGQTSLVLVISTDATLFKAGNVSLIDGGTTTVASFEPTGSPLLTPEPSSLLLLGTGLLGSASVIRRKFAARV